MLLKLKLKEEKLRAKIFHQFMYLLIKIEK